MLANKQIERNVESGGIIAFDCDNLEIADFIEESHQIHLMRFLSDAELDHIESLFGDLGAGGYEQSEYEGAFDSCWINLGEVSDALRAYLLSLRA